MISPQSRSVANFWLIVRHEARTLLRDRTLPLVCTVLMLMVGCGLLVGIAQASLRERMIGEVTAHERETQQKNRDTLQSVLAGKDALVPFSNPANPAALAGTLAGRHTVLPNAPLAALAVGQSDMMPNYYRISYLSKVQFMYDSEIENPWNLLSGHFDLAFVVVFVLPLLVIGLGYNLLSAESLTTLLAAKVTVRLIALLAVAIPLPLIVLLAIFPEARTIASMALMLSWALLIAGYTLFWFTVAAFVNVLGRPSSQNALIMVALWTVLVLILPVAMNLAVNAVSPAPSRTELASRTRVVTADALREYENLYSADYRYASDPEALSVKNGQIEVPSRMRAFFLAKQRVDEQIEPLLKRFDSQLLAQQRLVDIIGFLSPAILVNEALNSVAGNDSRRFVAFKTQTEAFHDGWRRFFAPKISDNRAMTLDDLALLPQWRWAEVAAAETRQRIWSRIALILALVIALGLLVVTKAARQPIV